MLGWEGREGSEGWVPLPRGALCNESSSALPRVQQLDVACAGAAAGSRFTHAAVLSGTQVLPPHLPAASQRPASLRGAGREKPAYLLLPKAGRGLGIPATRPRAGGLSRAWVAPGPVSEGPGASAHVLTWDMGCGWMAGAQGTGEASSKLARAPRKVGLGKRASGE